MPYDHSPTHDEALAAAETELHLASREVAAEERRLAGLGTSDTLAAVIYALRRYGEARARRRKAFTDLTLLEEVEAGGGGK